MPHAGRRFHAILPARDRRDDLIQPLGELGADIVEQHRARYDAAPSQALNGRLQMATTQLAPLGPEQVRADDAA